MAPDEQTVDTASPLLSTAIYCTWHRSSYCTMHGHGAVSGQTTTTTTKCVVRRTRVRVGHGGRFSATCTAPVSSASTKFGRGEGALPGTEFVGAVVVCAEV
jgi:hypothetical protein